jgi:hypothetical protein
MIGRITIPIPYQTKVFGLSFFRKRQAGFSFTNHATLLISQHTGVELSKVPEWAKENKTLYFIETLYAAYIAWCQENYKSPVFDKQRLMVGFNQLDEDRQKMIVKVWNESTTFGAKKIPSKKKR